MTIDRLGAGTAHGVLDVGSAAELLRRSAPSTLDDPLQQEDGPSVQAVVEAALTTPVAAAVFRPEDGLVYGPLVRRPDKIVCVGLNYRRYAEEVGAANPAYRVLCNTFSASLRNHGGTVKLPVDLPTQFDDEVELVISPPTRWIPTTSRSRAASNEERWQSCSTSDFISGARQMASYISPYLTRKPGDLIFIGAPAGVIQGMAPERRQWLKPGDAVACSVQGLGELAFTQT